MASGKDVSTVSKLSDPNSYGSIYDETNSIAGISYGDITDMRGVVDYGNLLQFAPYESGYSLIAVINGPTFVDKVPKELDYFKKLQKAFIKIIENEFRGLDGIDDITSDTMEITDGVTTMSLLSKINQTTNSQIQMRFFEKTGATITKYISTYLRLIRDPKTQAKTYGGGINVDSTRSDYGPQKEVFNFLYIVTDATLLHVEKAFLILNAQPTTAAYSDLYNSEKGTIENKEITVQFNCFIVDGAAVNLAAVNYLAALVNNTENISKNDGKININSWNFDWSISGLAKASNAEANVPTATISQLTVAPGRSATYTTRSINTSTELNDSNSN